MHAVNPRLAIANEAERVGQLTTTLAQALDLGASKHQSTLKGLANLVLMASRAIARNRLLTLLFSLGLGHTYLPSPSEVSAASVFSPDVLPGASADT